VFDSAIVRYVERTLRRLCYAFSDCVGPFGKSPLSTCLLVYSQILIGNQRQNLQIALSHDARRLRSLRNLLAAKWLRPYKARILSISSAAGMAPFSRVTLRPSFSTPFGELIHCHTARVKSRRWPRLHQVVDRHCRPRAQPRFDVLQCDVRVEPRPRLGDLPPGMVKSINCDAVDSTSSRIFSF